MLSSPDGSVRNWVAIGPASLLDMLVPLRDEHCRFGPAELVPVEPEYIERFLNEFRAERTALLVVEDPKAPSVRDRFRSPLSYVDHAPADVVVGWLRLNAQELADYARRAAALLNRQRSDETTLVLLSPRERRYLDLLDELETAARSLDLIPLRWSAERIRRVPLTHALRLGAAAVLYSGHGNPAGWFAYDGLTAQAITGSEPWSSDQTTAVLFSLSCSTGRERTSRAETMASARAFADDIVAGGVAGAVLAPIGNPLHAHSRVMAHAIVEAIAAGTPLLCDVLRHTERNGGSLDGYAVIGDPTLPIRSSVGAADRGATVFAPAPDAPLKGNPVWGLRP